MRYYHFYNILAHKMFVWIYPFCVQWSANMHQQFVLQFSLPIHTMYRTFFRITLYWQKCVWLACIKFMCSTVCAIKDEDYLAGRTFINKERLTCLWKFVWVWKNDLASRNIYEGKKISLLVEIWTYAERYQAFRSLTLYECGKITLAGRHISK